MYKFDRNHQCSLSDFDQPLGLKMNPDNRWVRKALTIPWKEIEDRYAKSHGIRISGPALGRPKALTNDEKKQAYADNTDRIEVERGFSLAKRCYGLGLIRTKLDTTTRSSIALSILAMNINHLAGDILHLLFWTLISMIKWPEERLQFSAFQQGYKTALC